MLKNKLAISLMATAMLLTLLVTVMVAQEEGPYKQTMLTCGYEDRACYLTYEYRATGYDHPNFEYHVGVDWGGNGKIVVALADGCRLAHSDPKINNDYLGWGKRISLWHNANLHSNYNHLNSMLIEPGECVKKGTPIGISGSTGTPSGPHLHLDFTNVPFTQLIWDYEAHYLNPYDYLGKEITIDLTHFGERVEMIDVASQPQGDVNSSSDPNTIIDSVSGSYFKTSDFLSDNKGTVLVVLLIVTLIVGFVAAAPGAAATAGTALLAGGKTAAIYGGKAVLTTGKVVGKGFGFAYRIAYWIRVLFGPIGRVFVGDPSKVNPYRRGFWMAFQLAMPLLLIAFISVTAQKTKQSVSELAETVIYRTTKGNFCNWIPVEGINIWCTEMVSGELASGTLESYTVDEWVEKQREDLQETQTENIMSFRELSYTYSAATDSLPSGNPGFSYWNGNTVNFQADPAVWGSILEANKELLANGEQCDPLLVIAVAHSESPNFQNDVCSGAGACGVWQFMPGTFPSYADPGTDRFDITASAKAACRMTHNLGLDQETSEAGFVANFSGTDGSLVWNQHGEQARYVWNLWQWLKSGNNPGLTLDFNNIIIEESNPRTDWDRILDNLGSTDHLLDTLPELDFSQVSDVDRLVHPYGNRQVVQTQGLHGADYTRPEAAIDWAGGKGTELYSSINGVVTFAGPSSYGNTVVIIENDRWEVEYLHLEIVVEVGDELKIGDLVGYEGNNGYVKNGNGTLCSSLTVEQGRDNCGYHLHFNVWDKDLGNVPVDPRPIMEPQNFEEDQDFGGGVPTP